MSNYQTIENSSIVLSNDSQEPVFILPDNLDFEIDITPETSLNDRFRSVTTGILDLASKADKRVAVLSFIVKALWPKSPESDVWRQLTEQVQEMIDAALAKEEFNAALTDLQTIYESAKKISDLITKHKKVSPGTLNVMIGLCQESMAQCHYFINRANGQSYSHHYMQITLSVASYHLSLLKYLYDVMEINRDNLDFAPDSILTYEEITGFLDKYEDYFSSRLSKWKKWRRSTFTHKKHGADYSYYETKDSQATGYEYQALSSYRGLRLHRFRSASEAISVLEHSDEASYNNGVCELISSISGAVYLSKYIPELGVEDSKNANLVEESKSLPAVLPLAGFSAHPQGPVFFANYREERKKPGWGEHDKYYKDQERWVTKISGQAKNHKLALIVNYREGAHKAKTHTFEEGADLSRPQSVEMSNENLLNAITVYVKDTYLSALKFEFENGSIKTLGDTSSCDYERKSAVPVNFVLHYIETSSNYTKSKDDKGVVFKNGLQAIKFRYVDPNGFS